MKVLVCENSIDGIFSGIYRAYESRQGHNNIRLITPDALESYELFCEYEEVPVNLENSQKVADTLRSRMGQEVYSEICHAINAWESEKERRKNISKAEAVYKTVVLGLAMEQSSKVLNNLGSPYVARVFQLARSAGNEAHHLLGFLRFSELENGTLFARIHPKNNVLSMLAEHFADRLPMENFIIYDENRKTAALHKKGSGYLLAEVPEADEEFMNRFSDREQEYRQLWLEFFHSIAIEARKNPKLQSQNIPKRFWQDTVELSKEGDSITEHRAGGR